ncbi:ABC-type polysaccharide transport system permease subunit [Paenibacillus sp. RC254]
MKIDWQLYALLAVMLHELTSSRIQKISQTILYLPHFISWVIIGGIANLLHWN